MAYRPGPLGRCASSRTPAMGALPDLAMAPSDFSSMVLRPAAMLVGPGLLPSKSSPLDLASCSRRSTAATNSVATCALAARLASRCSAPSHSRVSPKMSCAPACSSRSATKPISGLATMPELGSERPHSRPTHRSDRAARCLRSREISSCNCAPARMARSVRVRASWSQSSRHRAASGFALAPIARAMSCSLGLSLPISSTAPTLGLSPKPMSERLWAWASAPSRPPPKGMVTHLARGSAAATRRAVGPVSPAMESTSSSLRAPTEPSARR